MKYSLTCETSYIAFQSKKHKKVIMWITLVYNISVKGLNVKAFFLRFDGKSPLSFMAGENTAMKKSPHICRSFPSSSSTKTFSSSLTDLKAAITSSSEPSALAGSGKPLWIILPSLRYAGQLS